MSPRHLEWLAAWHFQAGRLVECRDLPPVLAAGLSYALSPPCRFPPALRVIFRALSVDCVCVRASTISLSAHAPGLLPGRKLTFLDPRLSSAGPPSTAEVDEDPTRSGTERQLQKPLEHPSQKYEKMKSAGRIHHVM